MKGLLVCAHSLFGHVYCSWKEVKHDNTVTWLAFWNDPISQKDFKYVFLAASSALKGQSDKEKYEKSRKLKVRGFIVCVMELLSLHVQIIFFCLVIAASRTQNS